MGPGRDPIVLGKRPYFYPSQHGPPHTLVHIMIFVIVTIKPGSVVPSDGRELPLKLACKFASNSTLLYIKAFTCWLSRSVN